MNPTSTYTTGFEKTLRDIEVLTGGPNIRTGRLGPGWRMLGRQCDVSFLCTCSGIHLSDKIDYFWISFSPRSALMLDIDSVTSVLLHIRSIFSARSALSRVFTFKSTNPSVSSAFPCIVVSVLFWGHNIYNTLLASSYRLWSSLFYRLVGFVN